LAVLTTLVAADGQAAIGSTKASLAVALAVHKIAIARACTVQWATGTRVRSLTVAFVVSTDTVSRAVVGAISVQASAARETVIAAAEDQERISTHTGTTVATMIGAFSGAVNTTKARFTSTSPTHASIRADLALTNTMTWAVIGAGEIWAIGFGGGVDDEQFRRMGVSMGAWGLGSVSRSMLLLLASSGETGAARKERGWDGSGRLSGGIIASKAKVLAARPTEWVLALAPVRLVVIMVSLLTESATHAIRGTIDLLAVESPVPEVTDTTLAPVMREQFKINQRFDQKPERKKIRN
jgi:hypothetical protein